MTTQQNLPKGISKKSHSTQRSRNSFEEEGTPQVFAYGVQEKKILRYATDESSAELTNASRRRAESVDSFISDRPSVHIDWAKRRIAVIY